MSSFSFLSSGFQFLHLALLRHVSWWPVKSHRGEIFKQRADVIFILTDYLQYNMYSKDKCEHMTKNIITFSHRQHGPQVILQ